MKIIIETIPHEQQRYSTVGDWYYDPDGNLNIKVSDLGSWREEALIGVHELVEVLICKHEGVTQEAVDEFDKQFEKDRAAGLHTEVEEPGDSMTAPYRRQHGIASGVERLIGAELGVDWNHYADKVESMP